MKLMGIEIKNFRGIKSASFVFPSSRIVCLIGAGDSGKSTLLKAIEWVLWPSWNLVATDMDFFDCSTENKIEITASIADLPSILLKEDKFGLYLRDFEKICNESDDDEPTDSGTNVLSIQLTIDSSLEPKWEIVTNRMEPKAIGYKDRHLLSFGVVGFDHEKDFYWGKNSVLQKYSDAKDTLHTAFMQIMRNAVETTNLEELDKITPTMEDVGSKYGVCFNGKLHNHLLMQNDYNSTVVGVFDGNVPFSQRGLGSKRLLSIGMNVNAFQDDTLTLIDEIETGLEPYRISALINQFRIQFAEHGQLIMTTHSISALCECTVNEVGVCVNNDGVLRINYLGDNDKIKNEIQALLRGNPEAFLCKRIIVCEGKTEVGLLRALDEFRYSKKEPRFSHYGVGFVPSGGGEKYFLLAKLLHECGYDVSILMDSDLPDTIAQKEEMKDIGIPIFDWEDGYAIEEQLFKDISLNCINDMIAIAIEEKSFDHVKTKLFKEFCGNPPVLINNETITVFENITENDRIRIGQIAKHKKSEWFKNISAGEKVGASVFKEYDNMQTCRFKEQVRKLQEWISKNDK